MKLLITNYTFNHIAQTITFPDYVSSGILLSSVLIVIDVTTGTILYNWNDPTKLGSVSGNVLTLNYNTTGLHDTDSLLIYYDDPVALQNVNLGTGVRQDLDSITTYPAGTTYKTLTTDGVIAASPVRLIGAIVNSTTSGVISVYDNTSAASGNKLIDNYQIAAGEHAFFNMQALLGLYFKLESGSINITFATL